MKICVFFIFLLLSFPIIAQENDNVKIVQDYAKSSTFSSSNKNRRIIGDQNGPFRQMGLSLGFSSMGAILEVVTPINNSFRMRAGLDYLAGFPSLKKQLHVTDGVLKDRIKGHYFPDYKVKFKPDLLNGHFLVDYYPSENAYFHVTGGVFLGRSNIKADGYLINPKSGEKSILTEGSTWPTLNVEGYDLDIEGGNLDATIKMGSMIKPYLGVGFGQVLPKNRLGFNLDLGIMYQGSYTLLQNGKKAKSSTGYESSSIDIKKYTNKVKVWPLLNFQLTYRIF